MHGQPFLKEGHQRQPRRLYQAKLHKLVILVQDLVLLGLSVLRIFCSLFAVPCNVKGADDASGPQGRDSVAVALPGFVFIRLALYRCCAGPLHLMN